MDTYGRNRQSVADIEEELYAIFNEHPQSHPNDAGEPVIPADSLVDVFRSFSEVYQGVELMTNEEMDMFKQLLSNNPGLEVTPQMLLQFIAMRTTSSPHDSPHESPVEPDSNLPERGRESERDFEHHSRSSSRDSSDTSQHTSRSRQSSVGPPGTPTGPSPFDASKRQRARPLSTNAPSSWAKRPAPARRRKSDAGSNHGRALSDSESFSSSPSSFGRPSGRSRAPSNPTSPISESEPSLSISPNSSFGSPIFTRPHSRTQSFGYFSTPGSDRESPSQIVSPELDPSNPMYDYQESFLGGISSLPMPRESDSDSDSDGEDSSLGLVLDRTATSSTASLEPMDRLDALQRSNAELGRKLMEAERTLQNKLSDHELELEEMQSRLEEVKSELSATKREEKELRSKERQNSTQITALESEIAKLQKSLDNARASYQSLQKQYQEQCAESERYRNTLRRRDQEIKDYQDAAALQALENTKWAKEHENYEERIAFLEGELSIAQQAHAQLDEQKQENLMLKETIDRMRFDMDEMRNNASNLNALGGSSGSSSKANSMSKSLGAELLGKMKGTQWGMDDDEEEEEEMEEGDSGDTIGDVEGDEDTEGEDVIETIITRKKRKVLGRGAKSELRTFEETKEYTDAFTQHEPADFMVSSSIQTIPEPKVLTASFSIQTDERPLGVFAVQTDPEPEPTIRLTCEMEIQTDEPESEEPSRSLSPEITQEEEEAMASSSSTVLPPTPKAQPNEHLHPLESPPAYAKITQQDREENELRIVAETLKKWHQGTKVPFEPISGGVSEEALEEWKALKEELGVECGVIDQVLAASQRTSRPRSSKDGKQSPTRKGRFYNIYNTYIYGGKEGGSSFPHGPITQLLLCIGASAAVFLAMTPYMVPQYTIPGGATYYDRAAWNSFNTMQAAGEGFAPESTSAVWTFLGRLGGGAARIVQGWPT